MNLEYKKGFAKLRRCKGGHSSEKKIQSFQSIHRLVRQGEKFNVTERKNMQDKRPQTGVSRAGKEETGRVFKFNLLVMESQPQSLF